ncbi:MAG: hypothetical protein WKF59_14345 [Chitinophagaceae bacterium]
MADLINNVINFIGAQGIISTIDKPFPLLYEEIFVEAIKHRNFSEIDIKKFIALEVLKLNLILFTKKYLIREPEIS